MDILQAVGIFVDTGPKKNKDFPPIVLLTHAHSDSYIPVKHHTVYTGRQTSSLIRALSLAGNVSVPDIHDTVLVPGLIYCEIKDTGKLKPVRSTNIKSNVLRLVIPFETDHSPGSMGFFFPNVGVLYVGDGRITKHFIRLMKRVTLQYNGVGVRHIVGDAVFASKDHLVGFQFPTLQHSVLTFKKWVNHVSRLNIHVRVVCPHSGTVEFFKMAYPKRCQWTLEPTEWLKSDVYLLAKSVSVHRPTSKRHPTKELVPLAKCLDPQFLCSEYRYNIPTQEYEEIELAKLSSFPPNQPLTICVTSLWFVANNMNPYAVYWHPHSNILRMFVSFHSSVVENQRLLQCFPGAQFSGCETRKIKHKVNYTP